MARRNMTLKEDTNLTKHMNEWLNTGRQKGHFGQVPECPGCGWHEETQLHMFQCLEPKAVAARKAAFKTMTNYYHEKSIPAWVAKPFIRMCSNICNKNSNDTVHLDSPPIVQVAIQQQLKLGPDFLLRGYLVPANTHTY